MRIIQSYQKFKISKLTKKLKPLNRKFTINGLNCCGYKDAELPKIFLG